MLKLSTDPVGTFTLRLKNLVAGSRVRVERQVGGAAVDGFVASGGDQDRTLDLFVAGNANNDLTIKVRNASGSPAYRPFETQAQAQGGVVTVYIFQELDE